MSSKLKSEIIQVPAVIIINRVAPRDDGLKFVIYRHRTYQDIE